MSTATLHRARTQPHCPRGHFMTAGSDTCKCGQHAAPARPRLSLVKPIPPLARRHVQSPVSTSDVAAGRAAMAARVAGLAGTVPVMAWHGHADSTATATLNDGTHIRYQPHHRVPFAAAVPCLLGAHHHQSIRSLADLNVARVDAAACLTPHADFTDWATAAARDLSAAFAARHVPGTARVLPLAHLAAGRRNHTS